MNNAWENLNKTWKERLEKLEDAMQAAVQYQDTLQVRGQEARPPRKDRVQVLCHFLNPGKSGSPFQDCSILRANTVLLLHFQPKFLAQIM